MYKGVKKIFVVAIVAALVLSGMLLLANTSERARAENKIIFGNVLNVAMTEPILDATVTLTNVHTDASFDNQTFPPGIYEFINPSPGMYQLTVQKDEYFTNKSKPFRFDGTKNMELNFTLTEMPTRDLWFNGTVGIDPYDITDELLNFDTYDMDDEDANQDFYEDGTNYYVNLDNPGPIVEGTVEGRWNGTQKLNESNGLIKPIDLWEDIIQIFHIETITNLIKDPQIGLLKFSYDYSETSTQFAFSPIVYGSVIANKTNGLADPWPMENNYTIDHLSGTITLLSNFTFGNDSVTVDYTYYTLIKDAKVILIDYTYDQNVTEKQINPVSGTFSIQIWAGIFELICESPDYEKNVTSNFAISSSLEMTILLNNTVSYGVYIKKPTGEYITDVAGVAYLYTINQSVPLNKRLIKAEPTIPLFSFQAYRNDYLLILDADGYTASVTPLTLVPGLPIGTVYLTESDEETYTTEISFIDDDWNNITVYRNFTLNSGSRIFGLDYSDIMNVSLQIDLALGNADGILDNTERMSFQDWIRERGPEYVTTEGFFSINSLNYISLFDSSQPSQTRYFAWVNQSPEKLWINTTTYYTTNFTNFTFGSVGSGDVPLNETSYNLGITMHEDTSTDVYRNYSYLIQLPKAPDGNVYERTSAGTICDVEVSGFVDVLIDPSKVPLSPTCSLVVEKALNGTANAKVDDPEGKYHILNGSYDNYTAIVAMNVNITFSAADSTDPNQDKLQGANYTWHFKYEVEDVHTPAIAYNPANMGYDEEPIYNYTVDGKFTVQLNITEAGGNKTFRQITVFVDSQDPEAKIDANLTIHYIGGNWILYIDENVPVQFIGNLSTDFIYDSVEGEIDSYRWQQTYIDENETLDPVSGEIWDAIFTFPGTYNITLNVTDVVGHHDPVKSIDNITVIVNDTSPPLPDYEMLENNTWNPVEVLIENETYFFNASKSVDNYDESKNLTYLWDFGDGTTATGINVSHKYSFVKIFTVTLNVSDKTGNYLNTTHTAVVNWNITARPNLWVNAASFKATPSSPEEGTKVTLSVEVTNREGHANASNVEVQFWAVKGEDRDKINVTVTFYDANDNERSNHDIATNETIRAEIVWEPGTLGNYTIEINATVVEEAKNTLGDNYASSYVNVLEAGWKKLLIYVLIIAIPVIIILLIWLRRKYKRGELFTRWRGEEEEDEEEEDRGRRRRFKKSKK